MGKAFLFYYSINYYNRLNIPGLLYPILQVLGNPASGHCHYPKIVLGIEFQHTYFDHAFFQTTIVDIVTPL